MDTNTRTRGAHRRTHAHTSCQFRDTSLAITVVYRAMRPPEAARAHLSSYRLDGPKTAARSESVKVRSCPAFKFTEVKKSDWCDLASGMTRLRHGEQTRAGPARGPSGSPPSRACKHARRGTHTHARAHIRIHTHPRTHAHTSYQFRDTSLAITGNQGPWQSP